MSGWARIFNNSVYALQTQSSYLARLQEQTSTGARLIRTSDDPADAYRVMHLETQMDTLDIYVQNIDMLTGNIRDAESQLRFIAEGVTAAKVALTAGVSDNNADQRYIYAAQIDAELEKVVAAANQKSLGQYFFGGANAEQPPYEVIREGGKIVAVNYVGSYEERPVEVAPGVEYTGRLVGDGIFRVDDRQAPVFFGDTGAAAGTASSSVRGDLWMTVRHTATDYTGAGGFVAGADTNSDTILGTHTLHVSDADGTISLDDGPAVAFDGTETNLRLTNANGDVVYINTTAAGGADGDYAITGNGTLSIDGGLTTTAIDFAEENQAVVDSQTGRVLCVDSRNITRTGDEAVRIPGTHDLFGALIEIRDLLNNTRGLTQEEQTALLQQADGALVKVAENIAKTTSAVGTRWQALDTLHNSGGTGSLDNLKAANENEKAMLTDVDILEMAIQLSRTQTLYQMTLQSTSQLLSLSLLDFI